MGMSIQKDGIPGFQGCIEHTTMLWNQIKTAEKKIIISRTSRHLVKSKKKVEYRHYDGMCYLSTTFLFGNGDDSA